MVTLPLNVKVMPSTSPKLFNLNQKIVFWSNPSKNEVMITSLIEMLELVTWPHLQYNFSQVIKFYWWNHGHKFWRHNPCFKTPWFCGDLKQPILLTLSKLQPSLSKQPLREGYTVKCFFQRISLNTVSGSFHET